MAPCLETMKHFLRGDEPRGIDAGTVAGSQLSGSPTQPAMPLDHRWWRFVLIAGLNIVVGSYSNKQESVAAEPRKNGRYERAEKRGWVR